MNILRSESFHIHTIMYRISFPSKCYEHTDAITNVNPPSSYVFHLSFWNQLIHWTYVHNSKQYMWTTTLYYAWCMHIRCTCTLTISIAKWLFSYVWCLQCEHVHFVCICMCRCYFVRTMVVTFISLFLANLPSTRVSIRILYTSLYYNYMLYYECCMCIGRCSLLLYTLHVLYFIIHQFAVHVPRFMFHILHIAYMYIRYAFQSACLLPAALSFFFVRSWTLCWFRHSFDDDFWYGLGFVLHANTNQW